MPVPRHQHHHRRGDDAVAAPAPPPGPADRHARWPAAAAPGPGSRRPRAPAGSPPAPPPPPGWRHPPRHARRRRPPPPRARGRAGAPGCPRCAFAPRRGWVAASEARPGSVEGIMPGHPAAGRIRQPRGSAASGQTRPGNAPRNRQSTSPAPAPRRVAGGGTGSSPASASASSPPSWAARSAPPAAEPGGGPSPPPRPAGSRRRSGRSAGRRIGRGRSVTPATASGPQAPRAGRSARPAPRPRRPARPRPGLLPAPPHPGLQPGVPGLAEARRQAPAHEVAVRRQLAVDRDRPVAGAHARPLIAGPSARSAGQRRASELLQLAQPEGVVGAAGPQLEDHRRRPGCVARQPVPWPGAAGVLLPPGTSLKADQPPRRPGPGRGGRLEVERQVAAERPGQRDRPRRPAARVSCRVPSTSSMPPGRSGRSPAAPARSAARPSTPPGKKASRIAWARWNCSTSPGATGGAQARRRHQPPGPLGGVHIGPHPWVKNWSSAPPGPNSRAKSSTGMSGAASRRKGKGMPRGSPKTRQIGPSAWPPAAAIAALAPPLRCAAVDCPSAVSQRASGCGCRAASASSRCPGSSPGGRRRHHRARAARRPAAPPARTTRSRWPAPRPAAARRRCAAPEALLHHLRHRLGPRSAPAAAPCAACTRCAAAPRRPPAPSPAPPAACRRESCRATPRSRSRIGEFGAPSTFSPSAASPRLRKRRQRRGRPASSATPRRIPRHRAASTAASSRAGSSAPAAGASGPSTQDFGRGRRAPPRPAPAAAVAVQPVHGVEARHALGQRLAGGAGEVALPRRPGGIGRPPGRHVGWRQRRAAANRPARPSAGGRRRAAPHPPARRPADRLASRRASSASRWPSQRLPLRLRRWRRGRRAASPPQPLPAPAAHPAAPAAEHQIDARRLVQEVRPLEAAADLRLQPRQQARQQARGRAPGDRPPRRRPPAWPPGSGRAPAPSPRRRRRQAAPHPDRAGCGASSASATRSKRHGRAGAFSACASGCGERAGARLLGAPGGVAAQAAAQRHQQQRQRPGADARPAAAAAPRRGRAPPAAPR